MPYIEPSEIERVKQIDLLTYLQQCEPDELVRLGNDSYATKTHSSLKLSNGAWFWWSRGIGGRSALDYLIKVRDMGFLEAIRHLEGSCSVVLPQVKEHQPKETNRKQFTLPGRHKNNDKAIAYLKLRGIDPRIIEECIDTGAIYESMNGGYSNVMFVGFDQQNNPRYAALRGCGGSFKGEAAGSDKRYAFKLTSKTGKRAVHIFEGAIDALSFATMIHQSAKDWHEFNLLSLGGIPPAGERHEQPRLPQALEQYLADNPHTKRVCLHLDNDEPGINAANMIATALTLKDFNVSTLPPPEGMDMNDYLLSKLMPKKPCKKTQSRDAR